MSEALELLTEMMVGLCAFSGFSMETMTRGFGWRFMDLGRRIERATYTARMLHSFVMNPKVTIMSAD